MTSKSEEDAIAVRGACKSFKGIFVLENLNLTVKEGTIYGLLGPSGCGKTTLLRCILERTDLEKGEIYVKVGKRRRIGYMPQELSLFMDLTLDELFTFYGQIYGMKVSEVKSKRNELLKLLGLPDRNRTLCTLSGGEQRRMSLAVTLLHDPDLVILDEPTVGVDSELRHGLWEHFFDLAKKGKTILITTHYTEEAVNADRVGLMRGGALLAEDSPQTLMESLDCSSLEEVFLKLCSTQPTLIKEQMGISSKDHMKTKHLDPDPLMEWGKFRALLGKHFIWAKRNMPTFVGFMIMPMMVVAIVNLILRNPIMLSVGIYSEESTCEKDQWQHECPNSIDTVSCIFREYMPVDKFEVKEFPSLEAGKEGVRRGEIWGLLHFKRNFSHYSVVEGLDVLTCSPEEALEKGSIDAWLDMSDMVVSTRLKEALIKSYFTFSENVMSSCGYAIKVQQTPIRIEDPIFGQREPLYVDSTLPSFAVMCSFYLSLQFVTSCVMEEKYSGQLERNFAAGVNFLQFNLALLAFHIPTIFIRLLGQFFVAYALFQNSMKGSGIVAYLLCLTAELEGIVSALLICLVIDNIHACTMATQSLLLMMSLLSGTMWPIQGLHYILRILTPVLPTTQSILSYQAVANRGWPITHPEVYLGFVNNIAWTIVFLIISVLVFRKRKLGHVKPRF